MQALVAQTQAAKQDVQQIKVQLDASAELLDTKVQEITTLRVSSCCPSAPQAITVRLLSTFRR